LSAHLNLENIRNRGIDKGTGTSLDYDDFMVNPSMSIGGTIAKKHRLNINYNFSSRRPRPEQLNPYIDDSDPYNVRVGNPHLKGEFTHNFYGGYNVDRLLPWWSDLKVDAGYSITPNAIERISTTDNYNVTTTTFRNIGSRESIYVNLDVSFIPIKGLNISARISESYNSYKISGKELNSFWAFRVSQSMSLRLKWCTISQSLHVTPFDRSAQSKGLELVPDLGLSVSRYWDKYKCGVSVDGSDLLHGRSDNMATRVGTNFIQNIWKQRLGRSLSIRAYWRFGKFKNQEGIKHESYDM
jgi:hypothetical protein